MSIYKVEFESWIREAIDVAHGFGMDLKLTKVDLFSSNRLIIDGGLTFHFKN